MIEQNFTRRPNGGNTPSGVGNAPNNSGLPPVSGIYGSSAPAPQPVTAQPVQHAQGGWAQPQAQQHQAPMQQQQPPQQQPGGGEQQWGGQPAWGQNAQPPINFNNPMMQFGLQQGQQFMGSGFANMQSNVNKYIGDQNSGLKFYFNVNNSYVVNKLKILFLPFLHKDWERRRHQVDANSDQTLYLPPRDDVNAPDLYIPTMSFVTYILGVGYALGLADNFTPEELGMTATKGLVLLFLEIALVKLGFFLLNANGKLGFLDMLSFSGYKFPGIVVNVIVGLLFGQTPYLAASLINGGLMALFMMKTLKKLLSGPGDAYGAGPVDPKSNYFLIGIALMQIPIAWWLCSGMSVLFETHGISAIVPELDATKNMDGGIVSNDPPAVTLDHDGGSM